MSYYNFDDGSSKFKQGGNNNNRRRKSNQNSKSNNPYHSNTNNGGIGIRGGGGSSSSSNNNNNNIGTSYRFDKSISADDSESLTYSATSSQAGESTDSSVADLAALLQLEKEQQHHIMNLQNAQRLRRGKSSNGNASSNVNSILSHVSNGGGNGTNFRREKSGVDSLGYSDDDDFPEEHLQYSDAWKTISGQPSDSYANDHGTSSSKYGPSPKSITQKGSSLGFTSPTAATADLTNASVGGGSLHSGHGSNGGSGGGTPNSPPPRHSVRKNLSHDR